MGGITGAAMLGLLALVLWLHSKEKRQRVLKEHYEEQFRTSYKYLPGRVKVAGDEADCDSVAGDKDDGGAAASGVGKM